MKHRCYWRKRSTIGEILAETTYVANRLSWKGAVVLGVALFVVFYWLVPAAIKHLLNSLQSNRYRPILESAFARRTHWARWLGITLGLVCGFFALRNYFVVRSLGRNAERNVGFFSRLLARWLD